jgi:hypothetical protein
MFIINSYNFGFSYDADAAAFFTATGITDATLKSAINQLVLDWKSAGLWTKTYALYPIAGGTSASHSYNLKNTALYQITWIGSPTHSSTGVDFNGSSQYGNTGLNPSSVGVSVNSIALASYIGDNTQIGGDEIGAYISASSIIRLITRDASNNTYTELGASAQRITLSGTTTDSTGLWITSRTASNALAVYRNGSSLGTNTSAQTGTIPSQNIWIGRLGNDLNTTSNYSDRQCRLAFISQGLSSTEASAAYTAVQNYQTTLGRQL